MKSVKPTQIVNKKLMILLLKTVNKHPEIEYINVLVEIVNHCIMDPELRQVILQTGLKDGESEE
jgi:hypothetical protein